MNENHNSILPNHVSFIKNTDFEYQDFSDSDANILPNKTPSKLMHREISNPAIYEPEINSDFSSSSSDEEKNFSDYSYQKIIAASSDTLCYKQKKYDKPQFQGIEDKCKSYSNSVNKKFSSACIPISVKNKLTLQKYRQIAINLNKRTINKNQNLRINIYEKKSQSGFGFPINAPVIIDDSDLNKSDSCYNNLENIIQKLKNEDSSLSVISPNHNEKNEIKNNNETCQISNDICKINSDINSTKIQFIEMETDIINDLTSIKSSIDKIIEERKEIQKQHKIWLTNMKKKICQTKEKTKKIERNENTKFCLITYL